MQDVCHGPLALYAITYTDCTAFDPKPFIRTFEAAVDQLIAVRKDVQTKTEQMEKSVRVGEREYSKKMAELNRGFEVRSNVSCLVFTCIDQYVGCRTIIYWYGE